jgi:hypothetical protein
MKADRYSLMKHELPMFQGNKNSFFKRDNKILNREWEFWKLRHNLQYKNDQS